LSVNGASPCLRRLDSSPGRGFLKETGGGKSFFSGFKNVQKYKKDGQNLTTPHCRCGKMLIPIFENFPCFSIVKNDGMGFGMDIALIFFLTK
jgi:hypothetical protein